MKAKTHYEKQAITQMIIIRNVWKKFKFNSDDDLPLKKTLDLSNIIVVKSVFHEGSFLRWIFV